MPFPAVLTPVCHLQGTAPRTDTLGSVCGGTLRGHGQCQGGVQPGWSHCRWERRGLPPISASGISCQTSLSCGTCPALGCHPVPAADKPVLSGVGGPASSGVSKGKGGITLSFRFAVFSPFPPGISIIRARLPGCVPTVLGQILVSHQPAPTQPLEWALQLPPDVIVPSRTRKGFGG